MSAAERAAESAVEEAAGDAIRAEVNYIVDTGEPPVTYVDWPEKEAQSRPPVFEKRAVSIRNGRPLKDRFDLDAHGFVFVDHDTQVRDFTVEEERQRVYDGEVAELIKRQAGASDVLVFDHTIRFADKAARDAANARPPVRGVHNDYTETSAPKRLCAILGEKQAEQRMRNRYAIIQVWRPIRKTVYADPLAICDGRSVPREGFIRQLRHFPHRTAEHYYLAFHPAHRWFYFPEMTRDEALVFKVFDTDETTTPFTAHTAFKDPNTAINAPPRESIETRAFAFFDAPPGGG